MNRKEMKMLLEERFERIALLETRIDTMEQLVDGFREREQSVIDTLHSAKANAARMVADARAEAGEIREQAQKEKDSLLTQAKAAADAISVEAQWQANELRATAKAESERLLRDAEIAKSEYEELVASYNAALEQNASERQQASARFAEYVKERRIEPSDMQPDGGAFYKSVGKMSESAQPAPGDDPATLMQNIYRIQKRPLPDGEDAAPEQETSGPAQTAAEEEEPAPEPFSEAAWADETRKSGSEPQAEFASAFENAFTPSGFEVQPTGCATPESEVESAYNDLIAAQRAGGQDETPAPEPYSEAAWAHDAFTGGHEPQAEGVSVFDAMFGAPQQGAFDGGKAALPAEPDAFSAAQDETPAPEPHSEPAWKQDAFTDGGEPQAEGASAFDAFLSGEETPGRFDADDEPREWEPEREPEMGDVPTVSRFMPESGDGEEVSLDQLLDEIIKAGE